MLGAVFEKPFHLARRAREADRDLAILFQSEPGCRAGCVVQRSASDRQICLLEIVLRHIPAVPGKELLKIVHYLLVEIHLGAHVLSDYLFSKIVLSRPKASCQKHEICLAERLGQFVPEALRVVTYHKVVHDIKAHMIELIRQICRV